MMQGESLRLKQFGISFNFDSHYSAITNDMGLLRMDTAATLSSTVATICLATQKVEDSVQMTTTGWGAIDNAGTQSTNLKEVRNKVTIESSSYLTILSWTKRLVCSARQNPGRARQSI